VVQSPSAQRGVRRVELTGGCTVAQIFICLASEDWAVARRIAGWRRDAGHAVLLDHDLDHGGLRVGNARADGCSLSCAPRAGWSPPCAAEVRSSAHAACGYRRSVPSGTSPTGWFSTCCRGPTSTVTVCPRRAGRGVAPARRGRRRRPIPARVRPTPVGRPGVMRMYGRYAADDRTAACAGLASGACLLALVGSSVRGESSLATARRRPPDRI
jgi:hypothetical protein